jgi:hypothetical protein
MIMKNVLLILIAIFTYSQVLSQYSWDVKIENVKQSDETTIEWEVWMKKGEGSLDFAYYGGQFTFQFNNNIMNGGKFVTEHFTIEGGEEMNQHSGFYKNEDAVMTGTAPNMYFNWASSSPPSTGQSQTIMTGSWIKFATFRAQLRKGDGNGVPHSFDDLDPLLAFHISNSQIVNRDNVTQTTYSGSNVNIPTATSSNFTPERGVSANDRQLASHWFTGVGNWNEAARWNNLTTENNNQVPPLATNNVGIAGQATVNDARTVNELTVVEGAYLLLGEEAQLTVSSELFNDNPGGIGGKNRSVTIAAWDFEDTNKTTFTLADPYLADDGAPTNINIAKFYTGGSTSEGFFTSDEHFIQGWTRAPFATAFNRTGFGGVNKKGWVIEFSTLGYQNLKISSKQWRDINNDFGSGVGPNEFQLQWATIYGEPNTNWTNIGSIFSVGDDGLLGILEDVQLPTDIENQGKIFIRWMYDGTNPGASGIEDIYITGEEIPPPPSGILIQSTATGTGSLIHNNIGVNATVQRHIDRWSATAEHGWHFLSSPVAAQAIRPEFVPDVNPIPNYIDFYKWDESHVEQGETGWWINVKDESGNWNNTFENDFAVGRGYLMAYGTPVKDYGNKAHIFNGVLNISNVALTGLTNSGDGGHHGWHLLGNPYSSAIKYNQGSWNKSSNMSIFAQIWEEAAASYKVLLETDIIPAHNGFMVYTSDNDGSLTIPADARLHSNSAWYKSTENQIILLARDPVRSTSQRTIIRFNPEATEGFDLEHDSYFLAGFAPMFYSISQDNNLALNTLPEIKDELVIPLGFIKNQSSLFEIEMLESSLDHDVYLVDLKENKTHNLVSGAYLFSSQSDDNANRFQLKFSTVNVSDLSPASLMFAYCDGNTIYVSNNENEKIHFELLNVHGQLIKSLPLSSGFHSINAKVARGIYFVRLTSENVPASFKITLQ